MWHPELEKWSSWSLPVPSKEGQLTPSPPPTMSYMETLLLIHPRVLALFANASLLTHLWSTITPRSFSALLSPTQLFCLYSTLIHHHHPVYHIWIDYGRLLSKLTLVSNLTQTMELKRFPATKIWPSLFLNNSKSLTWTHIFRSKILELWQFAHHHEAF